MLRNQSAKGLHLEKKYSKRIHHQSNAVLIHSKVLRGMGAGQVDLAGVFYEKRFKEPVIKIFEVKSFAYLSFSQRMRLLRSAQFISDALKMSCRISVIFDDF